MYGAKFSGYVGQDGTRQDRRPVGAKSLNLQPVIDNAKRPTPWSRIVALGKEATTHPSSGLKAIGMMVNSDTVEQRIQLENGTELIEQVKPPEELKLLADTKILRQVQKNFLGYIDTKTNKDKWTWTKGYPALIDDDGYLRCFISTTKETARWSAARPNLHNSPNKAEGLYAKILKTNYPGFIRTMFETPPGHVIIETDLASAELFMLAMAGNDDVLWDHCSRNLLDEDDPNFVDPHSRLCVSAFDLKCAPTKSGLKSLELEHLRNVGKCLAEDEIIWTDRGLFPVSLLVQQADTVIDLETRLSSIRGYTPCQVVQRTGVKSCTRIVDDIGGELIVSDEHKSFVLAVDGSLGLREARNTVVGDQIFVRTTPTSGNADYELPAQTRGKIAIAFLLESVLAGSQLNVNGCFVFALFMSSAVKRSNDEYVINVANSCGPKPASPELKEKFAASILQVAALLESVVGLRFNVTVDGRDGTISVKGPNAVEVFDMCFKHWQLLPSIVLMMSRGCRLSYLSGLFIGKIRGVRQGICALVPTSIERKVRLLAQSCGILLKPAGDSKDTTVLVGVREHDRRMLESLRFYINRSQLQELLSTSSEFDLHYERILSRLTDQTVRGERSGIAAKLGYTYTCNVSDSGEDLVKMIRELKQFISSRTVDIAEDDLEFIMFSEQILSGRYRASWVTRVEAAGQRKTIDVQTDDTQYHAIVCGNGVLTHNSVIYGWAYGRQAEAIVMGAKELGQKVSLEDAKRLLEYLPQQYAGAGRYLEEAASRVDVGYLVMPMGRIRRAPITSDKKQRSAYMREFMNAPIQGGVADIINNVAKNISDLRKQLAMRFIIALQMHDAFYFIVPYDEIMRLCVDIIPEAIVNRVPIVPFSLSGVRSNAPPRRMGFNISIMRRWKEKMTKAERVAWLESIGIDAYAIPRLELD
jgi:hypothetical protein